MTALIVLALCLLGGALVIVTAGDRNRKADLDLSELRRWEEARDAMRRRQERGSVAAALPWVVMLAFVLLMSAVGAIEGAGL